MLHQVIYQSKNVQILHQREQGYLYLKWKDSPPFEMYQDAMNACLIYLEKQPINRFLIDQSELLLVGTQSQAWLSVNWIPRLKKIIHNQPIYFSIISSKQFYASLASKIVAQKLEDLWEGIIIYYTEKENTALDWLFKQS